MIEVNCQLEVKNDFTAKDLQDTMINIRKSTLFILISYEAHVSYSLVELGLALSHCKRIMVFYRPGSIPKKLEVLADGEGHGIKLINLDKINSISPHVLSELDKNYSSDDTN